jgi:hypothetical protein
MIQNFTYTVPCEDPGVAPAVQDKAGVLIRNKSFLLGCDVSWDSGVLSLTLRISGTDQWKCSQYSRNITTFLLARHGLARIKPLTPVSVETEANRRGLTLEEGRTVRDYPTRLERLARRARSRAS